MSFTGVEKDGEGRAYRRRSRRDARRYIHHRALNWWTGRGNSYIRAAASGIVSRIPPGWIQSFSLIRKGRTRGRDRLAGFLSSRIPGSAYLSFAHLFTPEERKDLYNDDFLSSIGPMNFESEFTEAWQISVKKACLLF